MMSDEQQIVINSMIEKYKKNTETKLSRFVTERVFMGKISLTGTFSMIRIILFC